MPKVAVVGCGHWGQNLVRNFAELGALSAIVDPNPEVAAKFANKYGVATVSLEEALANAAIDGLVVASPAELHVEHVLKGLDAHKHIYVEKPMALSVPEAEAMAEKAETSNKILMVGHLLQYHPVFVHLREMTRSGELGKLRYVYSHRLSLGKFRVEEDAFWSLAPHDISMILALFDEEPIEVRGSGLDFVTPGIADESRLDMVFEQGRRAHIFVSWLHPFKEQRLVVVGDKGMAVFDDTKDWAGKLSVYYHEVEMDGTVPVPHKVDAVFPEIPEGEPLQSECKHFLDCIESGSSPFTDVCEALRVQRVLAAPQLPRA